MTNGADTGDTADDDDQNHHFGVGSAIVVAVGGVVIGLFGGFLQAVTLGWFPAGALLVLTCLVACIRALIHLFGSRRAGLCFFLGWAVASVVLALPTAGGDIVIARNAVAMGYLFVGVVLGTACCNVPARLRPVATA